MNGGKGEGGNESGIIPGLFGLSNCVDIHLFIEIVKTRKRPGFKIYASEVPIRLPQKSCCTS